MDMWNWLLECHNEGELTIEELEETLTNDRKAEKLWEDYAFCSSEFVDCVRNEVCAILKYLRNK